LPPCLLTRGQDLQNATRIIPGSRAHAVSKEAEVETGPGIERGETIYETDARGRGLVHALGIENGHGLLSGGEISLDHDLAHARGRGTEEDHTHVHQVAVERMTGSDERKKRAGAERARKGGKNERRRRRIKRY
jgi:hypothetical protein